MLYVNCANLNADGYVGVKKKILAQRRVFEKAFGTVYYTATCGPIVYLLKNDRIMDKEFAITKKEFYGLICKWVEQYHIKRTYIRYDMSDVWFVNYLEWQKNNHIKSVLEFPTMPYDGEGQVSVEDKYYREQLHDYIDCCTTYADFETVFHIPCIPLVNGVDINEQKEKRYRNKDGIIVLVAVASMAKWHGYERVIKGLHEYYVNGGNRNIIFNIVGEGPELPDYKKLTERYQLAKHVKFCGKLIGSKLDDIYDNSDIAVGSLGFYKINLYSNAPIKLREYCARGIPFVYGYDDVSFSVDDYFACQVPNDATYLDIERIIEFYEVMYNERDFIKDMREYTLSNLTWDIILCPVIDYLRGE